MTWAQGTFAFCFGILVPAVGVLCALQARREWKPWVRRFLLGAGLTLLAFVACCFLAVLCFPRYPRQDVSEVVANSFTLPGVAAGIAVIWWLSAARTQAKRFCILASALLAALYLSGIALCYSMFTWEFRKALPWSAREVHECYMTDPLLPGYSYQLKARITEHQFRDYIARFKLTPHTSSRTYSEEAIWLSWNEVPGFERGWWDPSDSLDSTFVWEGNDTWIFAKYENGHLYLGSVNH